MNCASVFLLRPECRLLIIPTFLALVVVGCEMQEPMRADEIYYVRTAKAEQAEEVLTIVHQFARKFDADVKGGVRTRDGTSRYVLEIHLHTGMQVNVSNFVREDRFIVAVYSGDDPDFSVKSAVLLEAFELVGLPVEIRPIPDY